MKMNTSSYYQTADLRICPTSGQVLRQHESFRLGPINMQVLVALLENQGQVVSRNEIFEKVWKNQNISDDTLTRCISDLRHLLGHHTNSPLIQTLPKRGYRWLPKVQVINADNGIELPTTEENTQINSDVISEEVTELIVNLPKNEPEIVIATKNLHLSWKAIIKWSVLSLVLLLMMTYVVIWMARNFEKPNYERIVLLPTQTNNLGLEAMGVEVDSVLKQQVLSSKHLRYLSQRLIKEQSLQEISILYHRFGARWVVESLVSEQKQKIRVSLSLVDSESSLVLYAKSQDFNHQGNQFDKPIELNNFTKEFIFHAEKLLKSP